MKVTFRSSFLKDVNKIKDRKIRNKIDELLDKVMSSKSLDELSNMKKLKGYQDFYRVRIGNYRIGIAVDGDKVIFSRALHRKDIYRYFP